jgi:hypothetical protein
MTEAEQTRSSPELPRPKLAAVWIRRLRYRFRNRLSLHPSIYLLYCQLGRHRTEVMDRGTELVIEGFPRSGNTFAVTAFRMAQSRPVRLGHHLHAAAHLIAAAKRGVPALAIVRDPEETVLSEVIREPELAIGDVLVAYEQFHQRILPWRDRMVIASFERVISDFGSVIQEVNRRFGTSFDLFRHTPENVARCFELIDERERRGWEKHGSGQLVPESSVPRPSAIRIEMKGLLRPQFLSSQLAERRRLAYQAYGACLGSA